ncbi:YihY/virulence factor BrkB family protein [Desulfocurvibacter africanus]|uniref:Ribonuclease BN n=1 Tax=Desulfocurvibacter africanus subsp. africanus str. Walvis Bay TaxID=690850 RepID=F3YYL9_DESAF|nr:YihY/virulence factor BrkB family protein [Desulfocurvibacter africanus]EGJ50773.1 ribonuclease BN [Desulfocurvibacter africanus subsp. africanus str. Walvis Bay]
MRKLARELQALLLKTVYGFSDDNCFTLAAALSYYALFSLAPLLVILISALSLVAGSQDVVNLVYEYVSEYLGSQAATTIRRLMEQAYQPSSSIIASLIGLGTLVVTATTLLANLQNSLNIVWGVAQAKKYGVLRMLLDRLNSLVLILLMGLLLLLLTVVQAVMTGAYGYLIQWLPVDTLALLDILQQVLSFLGLALLIGLVFKVLPDARIVWRDVAVGSLVTALLLFLGKTAIGYYLGRSATASMYGPASAIILMLLWINYSSLILFLGAEFTQAWSELYGTAIRSPWERQAKVDQTLEEGKRRKEEKEKAKEGDTLDAEREKADQPPKAGGE